LVQFVPADLTNLRPLRDELLNPWGEALGGERAEAVRHRRGHEGTKYRQFDLVSAVEFE
jgi:hypothetical protein